MVVIRSDIICPWTHKSDAALNEVLASAARLQEVVPDGLAVTASGAT